MIKAEEILQMKRRIMELECQVRALAYLSFCTHVEKYGVMPPIVTTEELLERRKP